MQARVEGLGALGSGSCWALVRSTVGVWAGFPVLGCWVEGSVVLPPVHRSPTCFSWYHAPGTDCRCAKQPSAPIISRFYDTVVQENPKP